MAIEIVDFPIKNGGSFHCFLYVYQRVSIFPYARTMYETSALEPAPAKRRLSDPDEEDFSGGRWPGIPGLVNVYITIENHHV